MLRSSLFLFYTFTSTLILFVILWWLFLLGRKVTFISIWLWSKNILLAAKYILGITYEIKGEIPAYTAIYAANHQSAWETIFFQSFIRNPTYIIKRELMFIPFFNLFMWRAGFISLNRNRGGALIKNMVKAVRKSISRGNNIIIFPEGTRVKPGDKVKLKPGIAAIYAALAVPIIPVSHNSGELWPRNSFIKKPGKITVTFHEPVKKGLDKKQFMEELQKKISA